MIICSNCVYRYVFIIKYRRFSKVVEKITLLRRSLFFSLFIVIYLKLHASLYTFCVLHCKISFTFRVVVKIRKTPYLFMICMLNAIDVFILILLKCSPRETEKWEFLNFHALALIRIFFCAYLLYFNDFLIRFFSVILKIFKLP